MKNLRADPPSPSPLEPRSLWGDAGLVRLPGLAGLGGLAGEEEGEKEGLEVGGENSLVRESAVLEDPTWYVTVWIVCVLLLGVKERGGGGGIGVFSLSFSLFSVALLSLLSLPSLFSLSSLSLSLASWEGELATESMLRAIASTLLLVALLPRVPALDCVDGRDAESMGWVKEDCEMKGNRKGVYEIVGGVGEEVKRKEDTVLVLE